MSRQPSALSARRIALVILCLSLLAGPASAETEPDPCTSHRGSGSKVVVVPSEQHRTLQAGLCEVADGGIVHLRPGTYPGPVTIRGKHVELRGTGGGSLGWPVLRMPEPQSLVAARSAVGVVNLRDGGSLSATMITVEGGDAGILLQKSAGAVDLRLANLVGNGRGILSLSAAPVTMKHVGVSESLGNGVSIAPPPDISICGQIDIGHSTFFDTGKAGIYVLRCAVTITHTEIAGAQAGGVVAVASFLGVLHSKIKHSVLAGIFLVNSAAQIDFNTISSTTANADGVLGDGITAWVTDYDWAKVEGAIIRTTAQLKGNFVALSERAAVSSFGARLIFKNNDFVVQAFDFGAESSFPDATYPADLVDDGGNRCFDDLFGAPRNCIAQSANLEPPEPVGGLE